MKALEIEDIIKLAAVSSKFRKLIDEAVKTAADEPTDFDEKIPAEEEETKKEQKKPAEKKQEEEAVVAPNVPVPPVASAPPGNSGIVTPEVAGANAARAFVGEDTMAAAATGDPNAQDMVARIAGQVAAGVAEAAARSSAGASAPPEAMPPGVVPPEGMPPEGVPPIPPAEGAAAGATAVPAAPGQTPEEAVANDIVPPVAATPAMGVNLPDKGQQTALAPQANSLPVPAGGNGQMMDTATVSKLIQLAKAGQI